MVALKLISGPPCAPIIMGKQERRGGIETIVLPPEEADEGLRSRNAVVALKHRTMERTWAVPDRSRNAVVALKPGCADAGFARESGSRNAVVALKPLGSRSPLRQ